MLVPGASPAHIQKQLLRIGGVEYARRQALTLLDRFGVETIEHLRIDGFASRLGVELVETQIDGAESQLIVGPDGATIVLPRRTDPAERRWSIAHELGHFVLDHPARSAGELHRPRMLARRHDRRHYEDEADAFASALLMPDRIVAPLCGVRPMTLDVASRLAAQCDVPWVKSAQHLMRSTWRVCAVIVSQHGEMSGIWPSLPFMMLFADRIYRSDPVAAGSLAHRFFDTGEPCGPPMFVPASSWLHSAGTELRLQEHSIACPVNDGVITMLWHAGESDAPRPPGVTVETMALCHHHFVGELEAKPRLAQIDA